MVNTPNTNSSSSQVGVPPTNPAALIAAQANEIQSLRNMINNLQDVVNAGQTTPIRVPSPKRFDGKRGSLRSFFAALELYLRFNRGTYTTDQDKIMAAGMFMEGDAITWFGPLLQDYLENEADRAECNDETKKVFKDYGNFKKEMELMFGEIDEERTAERRIQELKQTKSASQYTTEFKKYQANLDWDDAPLIATYYNGLKEKVKDEIARQDRPTDLAEMMTLAVRIDNRQFERDMERKGKTFAIPNTKKKVQIREHYDPMDIDRIDAKQQRTKKRFAPRGWTKEQKQKLIEDGACLGCGEKGHFVRECPKKRKDYSGNRKPQWNDNRVAVIRWRLNDEIATGQADSESEYEIIGKAGLRTLDEL